MTVPLTAIFGNQRHQKSASKRSLSFANSITRCYILKSGLSDWIELLAALDGAGIKYLVVGGIAVGFHGEPRYTKDLDVLLAIGPSEEQALMECLRSFGAPTNLVEPSEFLQQDFIFHFGVPPWRIDLLTSIPGVDFDLAYADRVSLPLGTYQATCISRDWLIKSKRASGRPQDLLDLQSLEP